MQPQQQKPCALNPRTEMTMQPGHAYHSCVLPRSCPDSCSGHMAAHPDASVQESSVSMACIME